MSGRARLAAAGLALALLAALWPAPASAHAVALGVLPAEESLQANAPRTVSVTFSEQVTRIGRGLDVLSPSGRHVAGEVTVQGGFMAATLDAAEPGTYRAAWRVVGDDSHPASGDWLFSVGHRSLPPPAGALGVQSDGAIGLSLQSAGMWLHLLGLALLGGSPLLWLVARRDREPAPASLRRLLGTGAALLGASVPLSFLGATASLGGLLDSGTGFDVATSSLGRVLALRTGGALAAWQILGAHRASGGRGLWAGPALAAALCAVDATASHTATGLPRGLALALISVHEAAMVVWLGALAAVLVLARAGEDGAALRRRGAPVAALAVATLLVSGGLLAVEHLGGVVDLVRSAYGAVLLIKLGIVGLALALGWAARRRIDRARLWRAEGVAVVAITAAAAALVSLAPVR